MKTKNKFKIGDWIEFGYERVWHISDPSNVTKTKNIMCIIKGLCLDSNNKGIKGIIVKYDKDSTYGQLLSDIVREYSNKNKKHECGNGSWQYRFPYIRKIPIVELVLIR